MCGLAGCVIECHQLQDMHSDQKERPNGGGTDQEDSSTGKCTVRSTTVQVCDHICFTDVGFNIKEYNVSPNDSHLLFYLVTF